MQVKLNGNKLTIEATIDKNGRVSGSGKTLILATSGGNKASGVSLASGDHKGSEVTVGFNAYIRNPDYVAD